MKLDRKSLAVHHAAADEEGRYAINGVLLETDGTIVATDGKMLMAIQAPDQGEDKNPVLPSEQFVIPLEFAQDLGGRIPKGPRAAADKSDFARITAADPDHLEFRILTKHLQVMIETAPEEGRYPDWRAVLPKIQKGNVRFCLGLEALEKLVKVLKGALPAKGPGVSRHVEFMVGDPKKAVLIRAQVGGDLDRRLIGALMPVTSSGGSGELTDWEKAHGLSDTPPADPPEQPA